MTGRDRLCVCVAGYGSIIRAGTLRQDAGSTTAQVTVMRKRQHEGARPPPTEAPWKTAPRRASAPTVFDTLERAVLGG